MRISSLPESPDANVSTAVGEGPGQSGAVDKSDRRVRRMFASIARRYDLLNHLLSLNIDRSWRRFTTRTVPPEPGVPVLDCCTGTADLALAYDRAAVSHALDGFGFVVPRSEKASITACSFSSVKFEWRAPEGKVLLRAFVGGFFGKEAFARILDSECPGAQRGEVGAHELGLALAHQAGIDVGAMHAFRP